jgi:hypothetical protein
MLEKYGLLITITADRMEGNGETKGFYVTDSMRCA